MQVQNMQKRKIIYPKRRQELLRLDANQLTEYQATFSETLEPHSEILIRHSGHQAYCPWILICDANFHLGAKCAYFVDLLFGWNGRLYVVMIPEVDQLRKQDIEVRKFFAREKLGELVSDELRINADNICLGFDRGFAKRYKWGIVTAEEVDLDDVTEDELIDRICAQLDLLKVVYDAIEEEQGR